MNIELVSTMTAKNYTALVAATDA